MFVRISPLISFIAAPRVLGSMKATTIVTRGETFPANVTLEIPSLQLSVKFDGDIKLE